MSKRPVTTPLKSSPSQIRPKKNLKFFKQNVKSQSLILVRGMGIPDYIDIATSQTEHKEKRRYTHICHPVVIIGIVTTIIYVLFFTFELCYMNFEAFRNFIHSLKRLENIKEWFRIIFKPWASDNRDHSHVDELHPNFELSTEDPVDEANLDPETDVRIVG